jgi:hypothetical protein
MLLEYTVCNEPVLKELLNNLFSWDKNENVYCYQTRLYSQSDFVVTKRNQTKQNGVYFSNFYFKTILCSVYFYNI